jgi:drug/metabolite transporter (DMT)-like permease
MLLSAVLFAGMGALVKVARQEGVPAAESTFVRFAAGYLTCLLLARAAVIELEYRRWGLLAVRGVFGSVSALLFFLSVTLTDLGRATLLCNTFVIFSALFSAVVLRERLRGGALLALAVSMLGVALVTGARAAAIGAGEAAGLLSGLLGGVAITSIRELRKTETAYSIFSVFCLCGMIVSLLMIREPWIAPHGAALWALAGVAVLATAGQLLMTAAYRYCPVAAGGLLSLVTVVLSACIGLFLFHEMMRPEAIAGAALILGAVAYFMVAQTSSTRDMT